MCAVLSWMFATYNACVLYYLFCINKTRQCRQHSVENFGEWIGKFGNQIMNDLPNYPTVMKHDLIMLFI